MSQRVLSVLERAKMVCWFEETNSIAMVARRYRAVFGMELREPELVKKWHQKFLETGTVGPSNAGAESLAMAARDTYKNSPLNVKILSDRQTPSMDIGVAAAVEAEFLANNFPKASRL